MKKLAILLLLLLMATSISATRLTILFSPSPPPEDALFSGDSNEGIFWQLGDSDEFAKFVDVPDLSIQYFIDMKNGEVVPYRDDVIPESVAPIVMADRDFNIGFNGLPKAGEGCTFFLLEKKNNQEVTIEPVLENKTFVVDVAVPSDYYLLVDADEFVTCLGGIEGGGKNISLSIAFNRLPSAYDYLERLQYDCGDGESCLRDAEGKEVNVTQWLEQGCPAEVILNGDEACKDWLIIKQREEYDVLIAEKENVDPVIETVIAKQKEAAQKDEEIIASLMELQGVIDDGIMSLIAAIAGIFIIGLAAHYMKKRPGVKKFISHNVPKFEIPKVHLPKVIQKKEKVYEPELEEKKEDWQPVKENQETPKEPEPKTDEEHEWNDNFEELFIEEEKKEDARGVN